MHYSIMHPHVPLLLINHGFCRVDFNVWFFYSFTFARSLPNVASTIYSRTYLNGRELTKVTSSAAVGWLS